MAWVKLDDHMPENSKVIGLGPAVKWTHIEALCYCARNLTDGVVLAVAARKMGTTTAIRQLIEAGLWERDGANFRIHDYLEYNPSKSAVLAEREQVKRRVERFRNGGRNAVTNAAPLPVPDPHPVPRTDPEIQNPPTPRKRGPRVHLPVDEDFIEGLVGEFSDVFTAQKVRDEVERALNHKSSQKWLDKRKGVRDWLKRESEYAASRAPTPIRGRTYAEQEANRGRIDYGPYAHLVNADWTGPKAARERAEATERDRSAE